MRCSPCVGLVGISWAGGHWRRRRGSRAFLPGCHRTLGGGFEVKRRRWEVEEKMKMKDEAGDAANVKHDRRCITFTGCYGADIRHLPSFSHCG